MTNDMDVLRFAALFDGRTDVYGSKFVRHEPVTGDLYRLHLRGRQPLGIFPIVDDFVRFAAFDLDEPDFDKAREIAELIPGGAWVERSESGNYHGWVFFDEPIEAWIARANIKDALAAAGEPRVEVFPKQDMLLPGMVGNFINLPYFGDERPVLGAANGDEYSLESFLLVAEETRTDSHNWRRLAVQSGHTPPGERNDDGTPFGERDSVHECATYMLKHKDDNPLADGHRHVVLFNLAKMLTNAGWSREEAYADVGAYNEAGTDPVSQQEVESTVDNAIRGRYTSTGCDDPLMEPYVSPDCPIARRANARR